MFEELKKKALKNSLVSIIIFIIAGIGLAGWNAIDAFYCVTGYVDFENLAPDEIKSQIVKVELKDNFGSYLEQYSKNTKTNATTTTHYYYVIWTGDDETTDWRYMTIKVPAKYKSQMESMASNTYAGSSSSPITFIGKLKKLDNEEYGYFKEYLEASDWSEEDIAEGTLPYYIDAFAIPSFYSAFYIGLFVLGIVLLVYGIYKLSGVVGGGCLKKLRQDITAAGLTEAAVESDYRGAQQFDKKGTLRIGKLMTYHIVGSTPRAIPNSKIMWAYQNTVTHRTNGVKTGTTYNVMVFDELNPKGNTFAVANEAVAQEMLQRYSTTLPWVVVGYSDELKRLYNKNRSEFLQLRYNTCEHVAVEPGAETPQEAPQN